MAYSYGASFDIQRATPEESELPIKRIITTRASKQVTVKAQRGGSDGPWVSVTVTGNTGSLTPERTIFLRVGAFREWVNHLEAFCAQLEADPEKGITPAI